ncbi:MAG: hypothetical protein GY953_02020 [bacterium]|nr:hypothetical protein [bacterium]
MPGEGIEHYRAGSRVTEHLSWLLPSRVTLEAIQLPGHTHRRARDLFRRLDLEERQQLQKC